MFINLQCLVHLLFLQVLLFVQAPRRLLPFGLYHRPVLASIFQTKKKFRFSYFTDLFVKIPEILVVFQAYLISELIKNKKIEKKIKLLGIMKEFRKKYFFKKYSKINYFEKGQHAYTKPTKQLKELSAMCVLLFLQKFYPHAFSV